MHNLKNNSIGNEGVMAFVRQGTDKINIVISGTESE